MFPNQDALNRHVYWTDPVLKFVPGISAAPHRIIGVTADIDDQHVVPEPILTIYSSFEEGPMFGGRLFIHTEADPYSLVTPATRVIRDMSADQPIERAATLEDVRAEVLTPDRLNSLVFGVFAAVALSIALVGVAGVLAFSVSSRTREFGIRLALGSQPRDVLRGVIADGVVMAAGVLAGAAFGFVMARLRAAAAKGYLAMRAATKARMVKERMISIKALVLCSQSKLQSGPTERPHPCERLYFSGSKISCRTDGAGPPFGDLEVGRRGTWKQRASDSCWLWRHSTLSR